MPHYRLVATSPRARSVNGPHGCDIILGHEEVRIGRGVSGPGAFLIPKDWVQVSTRHCRVYGDERTGFKVFDSSTNGTFVNDMRVPKQGTLDLPLGAKLRLSVLDPRQPETAIEYRLEQFEGSPPEEAGSAVAPKQTQKKRPTPEPNDQVAPKKLRGLSQAGGTPQPVAVEANNDEISKLNSELESARARLQVVESVLEAERAANKQAEAIDLAAPSPELLAEHDQLKKVLAERDVELELRRTQAARTLAAGTQSAAELDKLRKELEETRTTSTTLQAQLASKAREAEQKLAGVETEASAAKTQRQEAEGELKKSELERVKLRDELERRGAEWRKSLEEEREKSRKLVEDERQRARRELDEERAKSERDLDVERHKSREELDWEKIRAGKSLDKAKQAATEANKALEKAKQQAAEAVKAAETDRAALAQAQKAAQAAEVAKASMHAQLLHAQVESQACQQYVQALQEGVGALESKYKFSMAALNGVKDFMAKMNEVKSIFDQAFNVYRATVEAVAQGSGPEDADANTAASPPPVVQSQAATSNLQPVRPGRLGQPVGTKSRNPQQPGSTWMPASLGATGIPSSAATAPTQPGSAGQAQPTAANPPFWVPSSQGSVPRNTTAGFEFNVRRQ